MANAIARAGMRQYRPSLRNLRRLQRAGERRTFASVPRSADGDAAQNNDDPVAASFGLGGHKWTRVAQTPQSYALYVRGALEQGVTVLEAGQEGGEQALVNALQDCLNNNPDLFQRRPIVVTSRLGYRSWMSSAPSSVADLTLPAAADENMIKGDVVVEQTTQQVQPTKKDDSNQPVNGAEPVASASNSASSTVTTTVVHNLTPEHIEHYLQSSPLASFCDTAGAAPQITWMPMIHNPEAQLMHFIDQRHSENKDDIPLEERMHYLQPIVHDAMEALQAASFIRQFGVVSNGLGLPVSHPLHFSHQLLLPPYGKEQIASVPSKFTTVQLPANMLEPNGLMVARKIKRELQQANVDNNLSIWAMRPLTAYPVYLGTGMEQPYKLFDYPVTAIDMSESAAAANDKRPPPSSVDCNGDEKQWTHQWDGPPPIYQVALQTCMSHFDAEPILEAQLERELTTEERETIDGCKLIQSMLHDLDNAINKYNSLDVFEDDLYQRIIPLLADTFEALDETSSDVLQAFFSSYALAVRYTIAKKTRRILREGLSPDDLKVSKKRPATAGLSNDGTELDKVNEPPSTLLQPTPEYPDLDADRPLQELALKHVLAEPAISRVMIGTTSQLELQDTMSLIRHIVKHSKSSTTEQK